MFRFFVLMTLFLSSAQAGIILGAERPAVYLPLLKGKRVGVVVNQSSKIASLHLVDYLQKNKINIKLIFAPEHGFRGEADAGEHLENGRDVTSGLPIVSLYGKHKKPTPEDLKAVDILLFDIQDVGVRFYTYLSTLHYVLEAAAQKGIPVVVLDRPNPNANRIDGPLMQAKFRSFVGLHPVPILYGMTIGEYAQMINGEGWLKEGVKAELVVVKLKHYRHSDFYHLPIKPSPNLPNDLAIALYPSLAFFEGTSFSAGRGTTKQFQYYGAPSYSDKAFSFVPESRVGAKHPKHEGVTCYGQDLSDLEAQVVHQSATLNLDYLLDAYKKSSDKEHFFLKNNFFDRLAGTDTLRKAIIAGDSEKEIRTSWKKELEVFKHLREDYLLYP